MVETGSGVVVHAPVPSRPLADRVPEPSAARARIIDATGTALLAVPSSAGNLESLRCLGSGDIDYGGISLSTRTGSGGRT